MIIKTYHEALNYIYSTIPKGHRRFPAELGIIRQKLLLRNLGDPQNKVKVIHVAGTSGKGSVVSYLASLLIGHGFKVGTTLSPHLKDIRERIQINQQLIDEDNFVELLNAVILASEKIKGANLGVATFFEILIAMAYLSFYKNKVDYAVVETGMGGLFDGTNTVSSKNKIAVITRLGLDHTSILGKKITDIAFQKAGIVQKNNIVLALWQKKNIRSVLDKNAKSKLTEVEYIKKGINFKNIKYEPDGIKYDFKYKNLVLNDLSLKNFAGYQIENSALAIATLKILSERDKFILNQKIIKTVLEKFKFMGRMEVIKILDKTLILDGAHNPQKMKSFINSLSNAFGNKKFTFVIAFKQRKDFSQMLKMMIPMASEFIFTSFVVKDEDMIQVSQAPKDMVKVLKRYKYDNYKVILNSELALKTAIKESDNVVVTSSLYLLRKIYPFI